MSLSPTPLPQHLRAHAPGRLLALVPCHLRALARRRVCRPHQRGFAAIAAMFLLVVLAGLGAFMLSFSNTQQLSAARDIQGTRAYWAARAGLEWAIAAVVLNPSGCPPAASVPASVDTGSSFALTLRCSQRNYLEGALTVTIFTFESLASSGGAGAVGSLGYVERSVSATYEVPQ